MAPRHPGPVRIAALLLALAAAPAAAGNAPQGAELRLSDAEKAAILAAAADHRRLTIEPLTAVSSPAPRRVHGSAAAWVDSRGGYGLSSTTVVPLGKSGVAAVSVATENPPRRGN